MPRIKVITVLLILLLLAGNVFFGLKYYAAQQELSRANERLAAKTTNEKVVEFTKSFVEKVLKAQAEVDFETRLALENSVRNLNDKEVLAQWQKFTDSKTEDEAQKEVKNLLEMLVNKISL